MSDQTPADEPVPRSRRSPRGEGLLDWRPQRLLERLSPADRERVSRHGGLRSFERGATLLAQGAPHDGIMIIETGLVRSFYTAPTGREITLAYWSPGNFIGGPEIFGGGTHIWSAVAAKRSTVTVLPGRPCGACPRGPGPRAGDHRRSRLQSEVHASLAQMLGTRSLTERLGQLLTHLAATYGLPPEADGSVTVAAAFTHAEIANLIGGPANGSRSPQPASN